MSRARTWVRAAADHRFARSFAWAFVRYARVFPFLLLLVFVPQQWARTDPDRDSVAYYLAAERVEDGRSMYEPFPPPGPHVPEVGAYLYPPFLGAAAALLPELSWPAFARAWLLLVLAAFVVFAAALSHLATGRVTADGTLVAIAALALTPGVLHALNMGQADVLVWAFVGLALAFPAWRGAGFAAGAMTKVFPFWALLAAALRQPRRVIPGATAAIAGGTLIAVAALGPAGFLAECERWFRHVAPSLAQGQFGEHYATVSLILPFGLGAFPLPILAPPNISLSFAPIGIARALGWWEYDGGTLPTALRVYLTTVAIAAPLAAASLFRARPPVAQCALILIASVAFAPVFRLTYLPVVIAAGLVLARICGADASDRSRAVEPADREQLSISAGTESVPGPGARPVVATER